MKRFIKQYSLPAFMAMIFLLPIYIRDIYPFPFWICFMPVGILLLMLLASRIFIRRKISYQPFINFCCWIGWHWRIDDERIEGQCRHGVCAGCNKAGMFDSNGDFFTLD